MKAAVDFKRLMILGGVEWVSNSVRVVDGEARGEDGLKVGWEKTCGRAH